jgi:trehalose 6-phosphate synthase
MPWMRERLEAVVRDRIGGAKLVVVANREPYIHTFDGSEIRCTKPASGLTTALHPVMRTCGGTRVAHGSGDADRVASDRLGRVRVPPEQPAYTIRRVWLTKGMLLSEASKLAQAKQMAEAKSSVEVGA